MDGVTGSESVRTRRKKLVSKAADASARLHEVHSKCTAGLHSNPGTDGLVDACGRLAEKQSTRLKSLQVPTIAIFMGLLLFCRGAQGSGQRFVPVETVH